MGFWKTAGKIVLFPVYVPYKLAQAGKKTVGGEKPFPVSAVITTNHPEVYQYYYAGMNQKSDVLDGSLVVWRFGISEKERNESIKKLREAGL